MPVSHCDNCEQKIRVTPARLKKLTHHLCMFCSRNLPEKYRCKGIAKTTGSRCRQKQIVGGMCYHHKNQREDIE